MASITKSVSKAQRSDIIARSVSSVEMRSSKSVIESPFKLGNAAKAMPPDHACEEDSRIGLARGILSALAWFDAHWIGDLIGSISLFVLLFGGLFMGCGLGLK